MRLQSKVILGVLPLVLLSLLVLGFWTIRTATESIEKSTFLHMQTILDSYIADKVSELHELLVKNRLDHEEAFVKDYQRRSAEASSKIPLTESGRIFALDSAGKFLFCSLEDDCHQDVESIWGELATRLEREPEGRARGHIHNDLGDYFYVAQYFAPWNWSVFYAVPDADVNEAQMSIRNMTIFIAGLCAAASFFLIPFAFRRMFVEPINRLQSAAAAIARGEDVERIAVDSDDELGRLSLDMERMAQAIQEHHQEQRHWQEQLDQQIKARTADLHKEIEERKKAEEKIRELNTELEQRVAERTAELEMTNRELHHFIYAASHDLKTPLHGISHIASWLAEDYAEAFDENGKELLSLLLKRTQRLNRMLDGILEYSSVGRAESQCVELALSGLAQEIIQELEPSESLRIVVDELPLVTACETYLRRVFQHLLKNAMLYIGKKEGEIRVGCVDQKEFWQFSICDNGPGIEAKYHEKIFQIFQTLQARDEVESCGIGLALVKKIVEFSGGKIWLESTPGRGSCFFFTLPKRCES